MEPKRKHRAKIRRWLGTGCALALMCACASPRAALGQGSAASPKANSGTKTKTANSTTANPKTHAKAAAKNSRASSSSPAQLHPASHPAAEKHPKSSTAAAAHNSKSKYANSRQNSKRKTTARGQQKIDPERAQAIQEALIREHYLGGEAAGKWDQASEEAMRRYQADHGWQSKTVPDSRALISLGLGPSHDHLLNPESAMTTEPAAPQASSLTPASHSPDPGAAPLAPAPATPPQHDSSSPQ
ncbi:MAG: hypothetical protein WCA20_23445 [Candidatus Sulfotelmatobacter sp.]